MKTSVPNSPLLYYHSRRNKNDRRLVRTRRRSHGCSWEIIARPTRELYNNRARAHTHTRGLTTGLVTNGVNGVSPAKIYQTR